MELTIDQALQQGIAAHKEGKFQEAERLYRAILKTQPTHPVANHNLGVLAVSLNKSEAALPLFKAALEVNPNMEQFWLSYIDALIKENQFENAKQALEQGKKRGVASEKFDVLSQQLMSASNDASPSQSQLNSLLEHYQNGRYGDAEKLAISISKQFPRHNFSLKVLGEVLKQTGRISESLVASQKAVGINPQDAEAHNNLGATLQKLGRLEEAEASCRQAIALQPDYAGADFNLGVILQELGRLEEAEASYRQAIGLEPDFAEAHYNLGIPLQELGRLEEAEASYRQAIALKPDFAEAHNYLGNTLKELRKLDEAEASYRQAIALKHDYADALLNRGQLLFDKGEFEVALRDFDFCNTKDSRARALSSLYSLGRIEDIYKRIETLSEEDDENIRIAAIASFLAEKEKKDTAHNFCKNPIEFIHFSNISSHLEDSNLFVTEVIEDLLNIKTNWEPVNRTTRKGFQSRINLFRNPSEKMRHLKSIIVDELDSYYLKFKNESCSYIQKWPSEKKLHGWHVILKQQGHQTAHIHASGWLSGVIYLKVVPSLGKDEGAIEFSLNGDDYSDVDSPKITYQPKSGDIVFFPSSLHHRTVPFTTDTDRIIVAFDLMPKLANH